MIVIDAYGLYETLAAKPDLADLSLAAKVRDVLGGAA